MKELAPALFGLPPWAWCAVISLGIYGVFKVVTWWRAQRARRRAALGRDLAYLLAWPGMDAEAFLGEGEGTSTPKRLEGMKALVATVAGALLFFLAAGLAPSLGSVPGRAVTVGWLAVAGALLLLHFGSFHLLSVLCRRRGIDAQPLMKAPLRARSLAELWGRRWNLAFRDLAHRYLFGPLSARWGPRAATLGVFAVSGLVHELAISVPAQAGWGLPTLYFLLQAAGLLVERSVPGRRLGLGRGGRGRAFALTILLVPAPLLFHPPFLRRVVLPFLEVMAP